MYSIECNCIPVSKRSDNKTRGVSQVLIGVQELGVTDVCIAVPVVVGPPMSELAEPLEGLGTVNLLEYHHGHDVTSVHINGTDGHDLLTFTAG